MSPKRLFSVIQWKISFNHKGLQVSNRCGPTWIDNDNIIWTVLITHVISLAQMMGTVTMSLSHTHTHRSCTHQCIWQPAETAAFTAERALWSLHPRVPSIVINDNQTHTQRLYLKMAAKSVVPSAYIELNILTVVFFHYETHLKYYLTRLLPLIRPFMLFVLWAAVFLIIGSVCRCVNVGW